MTDRICNQLLDAPWPDDADRVIAVLDDVIRRLRPRLRSRSATAAEFALYDRAMITRAILHDEGRITADAA